MPTSFESLTQESKVGFFVKCQELMVKYHPNSPFVIREDTLEKALNLFHDNITRYKGFCYTDENICVLWNYILVSDPVDVNRVVVENAYKEPNPDFNGVSIDFAVFRQMSDCLAFIKKHNNERIKHILFIRDGVPKIYSAEVLLKTVEKDK